MNEEPQTDRDLAYLNTLHKYGKMMGLDDEELIKIAETEGSIDPIALKEYKEQYK
jgi:hypothetical protein